MGLELEENMLSDWQRLTKVQVLTHYGNGKMACIKCGFSDIRALTIDHIDGKGKGQSHRGGGIGLYSRLRKQGYPTGYQTLCMNCQFIKRHDVDMPKYILDKRWAKSSLGKNKVKPVSVRKYFEYLKLHPELLKLSANNY